MKQFVKTEFWLCATFVLFLVFMLLGCASLSRKVSNSESYPEIGTNTYDEVYLYTSWFRGMFGDGTKVWDGLVSDNELVTGLHPATKSEFDFKVRSYPTIRPQFNNKTNFLREIAIEI